MIHPFSIICENEIRFHKICRYGFSQIETVSSTGVITAYIFFGENRLIFEIDDFVLKKIDSEIFFIRIRLRRNTKVHKMIGKLSFNNN
ncbi:hypothetical protein CH380_14995 [Leptospira adleri]|uniref:Uncharacterized protein n=1 Tax=Leptospira adleri TaxID=2023186 RepID=A0A2M9YLP9_9LEPT|nr:hypothetical protein CH380_14995 [Leptospira adleri]PJZ63640.1 hypothetical protein CH376_02010 [Leptospira adleri]